MQRRKLQWFENGMEASSHKPVLGGTLSFLTQAKGYLASWGMSCALWMFSVRFWLSA